MKLKEYLELREPGAEVTCWDKDIDSEFYFYTKEAGEKTLYDEDFPNVEKLDGLLKEHLEIVKIRDDGVEVNLYEFLENPKIVEFAKKHMFDRGQYEDDSDVSLLLFDDNVVNFSQGIEGFSELMAAAIETAFDKEVVKVTHLEQEENSILVPRDVMSNFVQAYINDLEAQDIMHVEIVYILLDFFGRDKLEDLGFGEFIEDCLDCQEIDIVSTPISKREVVNDLTALSTVSHGIEVHDFADDEEKMKDFYLLSKDEFLASYSYLTEAEYDATKEKVDFPGFAALADFVRIEVPFRLKEVYGIEASGKVVDELVRSVLDNTDVMFDYEKFGEFLLDKHEEIANEVLGIDAVIESAKRQGKSVDENVEHGSARATDELLR